MFLLLLFSLPVVLAYKGIAGTRQLPLHIASRAISPALSNFIENLRHEETVPGIAVGVVHDGRTEHGAWGVMTEDGNNVTTHTLFGIASCSKAFASAALGILMDDFDTKRNVTILPAKVLRFDWHTKVADLLPKDWELQDRWAHEKATIRDVLSHVSGVASHDHSYLRTDTPADIIRRMRFLRPTFELRQQWSYSNQFYMLATEIITKYSGMSYVDYVQSRIFGPINMKDTTFSATRAESSGNFTQVWTGAGRRMPYWFPDDRSELVAGPMGVISNVIDMSEWLKVWLNNGSYPSSHAPVIPKAVLEQVTTAKSMMHATPMDEGLSITGYGAGWARHSYYGHEVIWHPGGVPGVTALVAFLPEEKIGIVVLTSASAKDKVTNAIAYRVIADILNITVDKSASVIDKQMVEHHGRASYSSALSVGIETYAGAYTNKGYGTIALCTPSSTSGDCPEVLSSFEHVDAVPPSKSHSNLYASFSRVWASHLRLTPFPKEGEHSFQVQFPYLFPDGYGKNSSGFEMMEPGLSEAIMQFVIGGEEGKKRVVGIGMYRMSSDVSERQRLDGDVRETADVWWEPV